MGKYFTLSYANIHIREQNQQFATKPAAENLHHFFLFQINKQEM